MTDPAAVQRAAYQHCGAFIDELLRSGVRHFCVSPGSRSTPLALTIARQDEARLWVHIDERSGAFFGLGIAKLLREPVALLCTSGTAAANFLPAVVEAFYANVPLIVLTADRPHELRDFGANQTIDQVRLYGGHVKWFVDLPEPEESDDLVRYVRAIASRAAATARTSPAGPVHLNWPFREPLVPIPGFEPATPDERPDNRPYTSVAQGCRSLDAYHLDSLHELIASSQRGLIVCGPQDDPSFPDSVLRLARAIGYPVLADPLSGVRCGPRDRSLVLDSYDTFLRNNALVERLSPDAVLRFGPIPTSKPLVQYLEHHRSCRQISIDAAGWHDPGQIVSDQVRSEPRLFCDQLVALRMTSARVTTEWTEQWLESDRLAREAIATQLAEIEETFEGKVFHVLADLLPDGGVLFAGNSMPVRDMDAFFPANDRDVRFLANRGAGGIDGVVSSALGAGAVSAGPLVLVIGDLSFFHDSNGLLAAKQYDLDATIILVNNDGGGIFSFLHQADQQEHFESLFGTPHGLDPHPVAELYGAEFESVASWGEFRRAAKTSISRKGLSIIEVGSERNRNVELHRRIWRGVDEALTRQKALPTAL